MKHGWMGLTLVAALVTAPALSWAEGCREGQKLSPIGQLQTGTAVIATRAAEVRLIVTTCGSACVAGLYDSTTLAGTSNTNLVIEPGASANQVALVPQTGFLQQPLTFTSGISFVDDGNVSAIRLYECTDR